MDTEKHAQKLYDELERDVKKQGFKQLFDAHWLRGDFWRREAYSSMSINVFLCWADWLFIFVEKVQSDPEDYAFETGVLQTDLLAAYGKGVRVKKAIKDTFSREAQSKARCFVSRHCLNLSTSYFVISMLLDQPGMIDSITGHKEDMTACMVRGIQMFTDTVESEDASFLSFAPQILSGIFIGFEQFASFVEYYPSLKEQVGNSLSCCVEKIVSFYKSSRLQKDKENAKYACRVAAQIIQGLGDHSAAESYIKRVDVL